MTTRILTLFLISGVLAFSGAGSAIARDNGGFSSGNGITGNSYAAFDDPSSSGEFDPSAIEPAAGDEEQQADDTADVAAPVEGAVEDNGEEASQEDATTTDSSDEQTE